jgi:cytosine/adenosine deaminase-related metal-dependent hydrolase
MATRGGARALHLEDRLGSLEPGKLADIIFIDREATALQPFYDVYSALVYAASPRDVITSIVHGRVIMENRVIKTVDRAELKSRIRGLSEKITTAVARGLP